MKYNYQFITLKPVFLILLLFAATFSAFSAKPPEKPGWNYLDKDKTVNKGSELTLLPDMSFSRDITAKMQKNSEGVNIELLYTMPLPDIADYKDKEGLMLMLYNSLSRLSGLSGLEYYSSNKKEMTLYLEECFIVEKSGSRKALKDIHFDRIPEEKSYVIYQKDVQFGGNWYKGDITAHDDAIWLDLTNINRMKYKFIPILAPESISIDMILIPGENDFQIYIVCQMEKKEVRVLTKTVKLDGFFNHRVSAYQGWIARQLYKNPEPGKL